LLGNRSIKGSESGRPSRSTPRLGQSRRLLAAGLPENPGPCGPPHQSTPPIRCSRVLAVAYLGEPPYVSSAPAPPLRTLHVFAHGVSATKPDGHPGRLVRAVCRKGDDHTSPRTRIFGPGRPTGPARSARGAGSRRGGIAAPGRVSRRELRGGREFTAAPRRWG